jgi:dTDP-4-amino-4,6-dideoxygalactose transaminase
LVKNKNLKQRDNLIKKLNQKGIAVRPVWTLLHKVSYLKKFPKMNLDNAIKLEKQIINLPSSSQLINRMYV